MNKSFLLFDKNNNLQKNAGTIVRFNFEQKDYLIYFVEESEQNSQIFVSRLVLNSEGKYFIDNLSQEEKAKLSNIVYNIVILIPTSIQKGDSFSDLINNLLEKFSVSLSLDIPELNVQDYYNYSSIAITSKVLVDAAIQLYDQNLNKADDSVVEVPTWTAPIEATAPVDASFDLNVSNIEEITPVISDSTMTMKDTVILPGSNLQASSTETVLPVQNETSVVEGSASVSDVIENVKVDNVNPQTAKLAVVSDPSLSSIGINVQQPNVGKLKNAGFASNKYVIIGTVCLLLAVAVIVTAYILITNMG